ncbi:MAG: hypothetical protein CME36_19625 [unclassified Hahellaceae]|nr:hypothetical protein [Hahellaceae bacterium]|tara:strand:- start:972 stop:1283 length:312 start_codon:yes stop_codon:yes gene_type:complete
MHELLSHLEVWKKSKVKIFDSEGYKVSISEEQGDSKKARYIDLGSDKLVARATLWETGELELEALDAQSGEQVLQKSVVAPKIWQLDDELNWWLSEVSLRANE